MTDLSRIKYLARQLRRQETFRAELAAEMRRAVAAGATLRAVGEAAGLSHQRVFQIVKEEEK